MGQGEGLGGEVVDDGDVFGPDGVVTSSRVKVQPALVKRIGAVSTGAATASAAPAISRPSR